MEKAKRARKAETPKQPSLRLRLCALHFYPDPEFSPKSVLIYNGHLSENSVFSLPQMLLDIFIT